MSLRTDLADLSSTLDSGSQPSAEFERRLGSDPHLARRARALRRVDALLRAELCDATPGCETSIAPRILSRLGARPATRRPESWIALAAAAAVLVLAPLPRQPAPTPQKLEVGPTEWAWAERLLQQGPIAPEQTLVVEAQRLADDTRLVARSLWSSLPLSTWIRPPAWIFDEQR